ncbi:hypothetical protein [Flavicella sediminum]|uniref:hypothetical protein n=1 Tax=Flavicella sediminum TaxID=2585141 RepID=UPI001123F6EC|nr:hypothetical protein [Flavicella sediminum]
MKKILLAFVVLLTTNVFAQRPGGGGRQQNRNPQSEQTQKREKFSASNAAGIFYYDIDEVVKKTKVKDEQKQYQVKKALREYNAKIRELSFINTEKFEALDILVNSMQKRTNSLGSQARDASGNKESVRKKIGATIRPVKDEIRHNEKELNQFFESILSKKQLKKWLKYQKKENESLQPKQAQNRDGQRDRPAGGGRGSMR